MSCCAETIIPFFYSSSTTIGYTGTAPQIIVYYVQDGEYVLSDDMSGISFDGTFITVDHGGPQSGIIKYR